MRIQGRHIGTVPAAPQHLAEMQTAHARGYDTITASAYQALIQSGREPDEFLAMSDDEIGEAVGYAVLCDLA